MLHIDNVDDNTFTMYGDDNSVPADVYPKDYQARAIGNGQEAQPRITISHKNLGNPIAIQRRFDEIKINDVAFLTGLSAVTAFNALMASATTGTGGGSGFGAEYQIPQVDITGTQDTFTLPFLIDTNKFYGAINGTFFNTRYDGITSITNGTTTSEIVFTDPIPLDNVVVILYTAL